MNKPRLSRLVFGPLAVLALGTSMTLGCSDVSDETAYTDIGPLLSVSAATSSSDINATNTAAKAKDGSMSTRWESVHGVDPQWLRFDLGSVQSITGVTIDWEGAYAKNYTVDVSSDGTTWTTIKTVTNKASSADDNFTGLSGSGRYVRMYGTARATGYGYSVYEMLVAGGGSTGAGGTTGAAGTGSAGNAVATASNTGGADVPNRAVDNNTGTRWSSGTDLTAGMWFQVDLGSTQSFNTVTMISNGDYVRGYQVLVSSNGTSFTQVATGTGTGSTVTSTFATQSARYVRIQSTGTSTAWWSIYEITVSMSGSTGAGGTTGAAGTTGAGGTTGAAGTTGTGATGGPSGLGRAVTDLDAGWKFTQSTATTGPEATGYGDGGWSTVNVPHTMDVANGQDGPGTAYYRGIGWYRRHVNLTSSDLSSGRQVYLQFDAANTIANVYVNGAFVGKHEGGYARFRFDVTSRAVVGDNVVAVMVDNRPVNFIPPLTADYTFWGGMYRDVSMKVVDPLHIDLNDFGASGIYVNPTSVSSGSANVSVRVRVANESGATKTANVSVDIKSPSGATVATLTGSASIGAGVTSNITTNTTTVSNPELWKGIADPNLYSAVVTVKDGSVATDTDTEKFGFRTFSVSASSGFSLNGSYLDLHGVNRHQDRLGKGWAISKSDEAEDVALLKEMGTTGIRTAHYPNSENLYDLLDQNGIVTWVEIPVVGTSSAGIPSTTAAEYPAFKANARQQLQEMIRQLYNHPAIMFWGLSNEVGTGTQSKDLLTELNQLAKAEDPTGRLTTCASNTSGVNASTGAVSSPNNSMDNVWGISDLSGFNRYDGWYGGTKEDFTKWVDFFHNAYPNERMSISEWGAGMAEDFHSDTPANQDHTEEYGIMFHDSYWSTMRTRNWIWGKFIWNMFDFAADTRHEGTNDGRNDKGMMTFDRKTRKDVFYYYKANWSSSPVLTIASKRFTAARAATITVKVFSNMDGAPTLTVNGASKGAGSCSASKVCTWTGVAMNAGANPVSVSGTKGGTAYSDSVTWNR